MSNERIEKIPVGGLWEFAGWEIHFDYALTLMARFDQSCPHCHSPRKDRLGYEVVTCPRVVVASNEAGHNTTGVCLDCILEAARALEVKEKPPSLPKG